MRAFVNSAVRQAAVAPPVSDAAPFHRSLPGYRSTPVRELTSTAAEFGLAAVRMKDESDRLGLPAFKVLGASWAVERLLDARPDVHTLVAASGTAVVHVALGLAVGPYRRHVVRGTFEEVRDLALTDGMVTLVLFGVAATRVATDPGGPILVPGTVPLVAGLVAYSVQLAIRLVFRTRQQRSATRRPGSVPVIVFGAGTGGRLLVRNLVHDPASPYLPVALLDDDRRLRRARIEGVQVRGDRTQLPAVARTTGARHLVIAIPGATSATIRRYRA